MRVFVDTNVLVSAMMGHGLCRDLLDRLVLNHTVVLGEPVREELRRVLLDKFGVPRSLWRELDSRLDDFEPAKATPGYRNADIPDEDDVAVIGCAVAAQVDLIVTGDQGLLALGQVDDVPLVSPRACWSAIG